MTNAVRRVTTSTTSGTFAGCAGDVLRALGGDGPNPALEIKFLARGKRHFPWTLGGDQDELEGYPDFGGQPGGGELLPEEADLLVIQFTVAGLFGAAWAREGN